jgi:hypothetical protein
MQEFIENITKELNTQDNRITSDPIFLIQKKVRDWGIEKGYTDKYVWANPDDEYIEADEEKSKQLDEDDDNWDIKEEDECWKKMYYRERWEFVTACFTEKAADDFIAANKHRYGEMRTYVDSLYRNDEMRELRNLLLGGKLHVTG